MSQAELRSILELTMKTYKDLLDRFAKVSAIYGTPRRAPVEPRLESQFENREQRRKRAKKERRAEKKQRP